MRYTIEPRQPHRNLAAGKRSIVLACASIAMVLGATSAGSSLIVDDTQAGSLTTSNSIPTVTDTSSTPAVTLGTTAKPLGTQRPLVLNTPATKPAGLPLESVPAAAAAVLVQLSKHASLQPSSSSATPTSQTSTSQTTTNTTAPSNTSTSTSTPTSSTPETPPADPETTPSEPPPTTDPTEPPTPTSLDTTSSPSGTSADESF